MSILNSEELRAKLAELREKGGADLSTEEDLSLAVMNLVSLEEHFFFTAEKTGKPEYFDLLGKVREMRKELLGRMLDKNEGETWCIGKHLLAASMRLIEVGTKLHSDGKTEDAKRIFDRAYEAYSLFWAVRLKVIDASGFKKVAENDKPWTYQDIVEKMVNCCDE